MPTKREGFGRSVNTFFQKGEKVFSLANQQLLKNGQDIICLEIILYRDTHLYLCTKGYEPTTGNAKIKVLHKKSNMFTAKPKAKNII